MRCYACGKDYTTYKGFCSHVTSHHQILVKEYYDNYIKEENEEICNICGNTLKFINAKVGYSKDCTHERFKCKICGKELETHDKYTQHIAQKHRITQKEYYDRYANSNAKKICDICGLELKFINLSEGYSNSCTHQNFKCKICGRDHLKTSKALLMHLVRDHSRVSHQEYYDSYLKKENEGLCKICNEPTIFENFTLGYRNCCCADCTREYNTGYRNNFQTPEAIEKIKKTSIKTRNKNLRIFEKDNDLILISNLNLKYFKRIVEYKNLEVIYYHQNKYVKKSEISLKELRQLDKKFQKEAKTYNSKYEAELHEWLKEIYQGEILDNKYGIIKDNTKKQLDFYIPEKNLAIEFNGDFWHSVNTGRDPNYHLNKTQLCQEKGIQLIHIFEYEWNSKKDILKSIISSALGIYKSRIYARDCEVKEVSSKEAKKFLEENHLQEFVASKYRIGLYFKNQLVQLLCFGNSRFKKGEIELLRMCTKLNTQVIGGFSKLLRHQPYNKFISYVDLSKFSANGYLKNGFKIIGQSQPSYKYLQGERVLNRFNAQKHKLKKLLGNNFDKSKTESQNMQDAGWWKIYDCGNLKLKFGEL